MLRHLEEAIGSDDGSLTSLSISLPAARKFLFIWDLLCYIVAAVFDRQRVKMPVQELDHNQLLSCLPLDEKRVLSQKLQLVSLRTKEEIIGMGSPLRHVHFPLTAVISLMNMQEGGQTVEVAVIGKEGCTCFHVLDGLKSSPSRVVVQIGGSAFRMPSAALDEIIKDLPVFAQIVRRYSAVLFRHSVISVGCSQFHSVEQRLARWLLAHNNRTGATTFPFTHEFLAEQLGAQRATVTQGLAELQSEGLLSSGYGTVELINIPKLQMVACECYGLSTLAIDEYLSDIEMYQ